MMNSQAATDPSTTNGTTPETVGFIVCAKLCDIPNLCLFNGIKMQVD